MLEEEERASEERERTWLGRRRLEASTGELSIRRGWLVVEKPCWELRELRRTKEREPWVVRMREEEGELRRSSVWESTRLVWAVRILRKSWKVQELLWMVEEPKEELPIHRTTVLVLELRRPSELQEEALRIRRREEPMVSTAATKEVLDRDLRSWALRGELSFLRKDSTARLEVGWASIRRRRVEELPSSALGKEEETRPRMLLTCRDRLAS